jgi:LVIVD repeat
MSYAREPFSLFQKSSLRLISFAAVIMVAANVFANTKSTEVPAKVIAHLQLREAPGSEMFLQMEENRRYLYVQDASKRGFTVIDVTKATAPTLVTQRPASKDAMAGQLQVVGPDVALAEVPDQKSQLAVGVPENPTETVKIVDLSDPSQPRVIQTFAGVASTLQDRERGLVYVVNNDGLWILRHPKLGLTPAKNKRPCGSEDAIQAMPPDCQ